MHSVHKIFPNSLSLINIDAHASRCPGWLRLFNTEETIWNSKCSPASDPFDKCLRLLAVCVIKQNGILWKPFLWCHRHLSKTLDVYEGETEFDSSDISLNHNASNAAVLSPEAIKEVSRLIHLLYNKLTAHTVNMLPDPPRLLWQTFCLLCSCLLCAREAKKSHFCCIWLFRVNHKTINAPWCKWAFLPCATWTGSVLAFQMVL